MCASCGCGIPEDDHGDPRNIVFSDLTAAAKAQGIAENDVVNNMHAMTHQSHKVDQKSDPEPIKDAKTKGLRKAVRSLGDEIADAVLNKGLQREEKGRFTGTKDDTHSHRTKDGELVSHTHDSEKGHTHPGRTYGPSFNHR